MMRAAILLQEEKTQAPSSGQLLSVRVGSSTNLQQAQQNSQVINV